MLYSSIEKIDFVDPLAALERLVARSLVDDELAAQIADGRAYWTRPSDGVAIGAAGAATVFSPRGEGRFRSIAASWNSLLDAAKIEGPARPRSTGPLLIGGFAFEPDGPVSRVWSGFPAAHFILPRVLVTTVRGESFLTINSIDDSSRVDPRRVGRIRDAVMSPDGDFETAGGDVAVQDLEISDLSSESAWIQTVAAAVGAIRSGELEKVVIARGVRATAQSGYDAFDLLERLRDTQRDSFVFGYWRGNTLFAGASPERLVRVEGNVVEASSLAGTIGRGATPAEDAANTRALIGSAKDRKEHVTVRDSLHAALAEECESVAAPSEPSLLTLPHMHHLHTPVSGRLRDGRTILDLVERLHPTPAVGGSPRVAALEFIREHEGLDRGWYAAPIGWIGTDGGEFAVALRSAVIDGAEATMFAGCGIVAESDARLEYAESSLKLKVMLSALGSARATGPDDVMTVETMTGRAG